MNEGDLAIEPGRTDPAAVGTDEDEQPLAEMSQTIASSRNRTRAGELSKIQAALTRLEQDPEGFGLCAECQQAKDGPKQPGGRRHLRDYK